MKMCLIFFFVILFFAVAVSVDGVGAVSCDRVNSGTTYWYACDGVRVTQVAAQIDHTLIDDFGISGDRVYWKYGVDSSSWNYAYYSNSIFGGNIIQVTNRAEGSNSISGFKIKRDRDNAFTPIGNRALWVFEKNPGGRQTEYYASCLTSNQKRLLVKTGSFEGTWLDGPPYISISGDRASWRLCHSSPSVPCSSGSTSLPNCLSCVDEPSCCDNADRDCDGVNLCQNDCNDLDSNVNPNAPEVCDGIDNNCNGQIDEGIVTGIQCGSDEGQCSVGTMVCSNGELVCGGGVVLPSTEVCDGLDNDCNGLIDENVKNACGNCGAVPDEICDGIDNNCDGVVDEDIIDCDSDVDGIENQFDNCVSDYNPDQLNSDVQFVSTGVVEDEFVPGEVIVKFKEDFGEEAFGFDGVGLGDGEVSREDVVLGEGGQEGLENIYVYNYPLDVDLGEVVKEFEARSDVEFAQPNYIVRAVAIPDDDFFLRQWAHMRSDSQAGWDVEKGSSDVVIAVVDTGVNYFHPDLADNIVSTGRDFYDNDNEAMDANGHGTHVAGIAAAVTDNGRGIAGVCWNCGILPVRFLGPGGGGSSRAAADAITYAADSGAEIISNSWGSYSDNPLVHAAIVYAHNKGSVVVGAAGNDNVDTPFYPAAYPEVLSVSATHEGDGKASFSNHGGWVDVAAPGERILSTHGSGYRTLSGTSMAAPFVSGLAGLVLSERPGMSNVDVRRTIMLNTDPISAGVVIGTGRVNVFKTLRFIANEIPESFLWESTAVATEIFDTCSASGSGQRLKNTGGSEGITVFDLVKDLGEIQDIPEPEQGGVITNVQYGIGDGSSKVLTWVEGNHRFACLDSDENGECDYLSVVGGEESFEFEFEKGDLCDVCPSSSVEECNPGETAAAVVGREGGVLQNDAKLILVELSAGSLDDETSIAVTSEEAFGVAKEFRGVSKGYHLTPDGKVFLEPVTISIPYGGQGVVDEDSLQILSSDGGQWEGENTVVDKENKIAKTDVMHFSTFVLVERKEDNGWCDGADVNKDENVAADDLSALLGKIGTGGCDEGNDFCEWADVNRDGNVAANDLSKLLGKLGTKNCFGLE